MQLGDEMILPERTKLLTASKLYHTIETTFAHWDDVPHIVHDELYTSYLGDVLAAGTRFDFFMATQKYLATFSNGHTEFVDTEAYEGIGKGYGFHARLVQGKWIVAASTVAGIPVGEEIEALDGIPIESALREPLSLMSASRPEYKAYALFRRPFFLPPQAEVNFTSGKSVRVAKGNYPVRQMEPVELDDDGLLPRIIIRSFDSPEYEEAALSLVSKLRDSSALVLDIRGNGGGDTPIELTKALMNQPYPTWREATPFQLGLEAANAQFELQPGTPVGQVGRFTLAWTSTMQKPDENAFCGKLFIIHDIGCKSAAEDFLMPFKVTGRATLLGETTAGSSGQPFIHRPYSGATFSIGAKRQFFPDGTQFEGIGIRPDVEVLPGVPNVRDGVDPMLSEIRKIL